jgi:hypothetical protein
MKQLEAIKSFGSLLAIFTSLLVGQKSENMAVLGRFFVPCSNMKPFHCTGQLSG